METFKYDVFISHAVEDKIEIANELYEQLEKAGLKVWYSGNELSIGDRIEHLIQKGLEQSRFGIAILTPNYLRKSWTMREFYSLLAKEYANRKVILPVLHNVTISDLKEKDLTIADKFGISTDNGMQNVVQQIVKVVNNERDRSLKVSTNLALSDTWRSGVRLFKKSTLIAILSTLLISISGFAVLDKIVGNERAEHIHNKALESRMNLFIQKMEERQLQTLNQETAYVDPYQDNIIKIDLTTGKAMDVKASHTPKVFLVDKNIYGDKMRLKYAIVNRKNIAYKIANRRLQNADGELQYLVDVSYQNPLRFIDIDLLLPSGNEISKTDNNHPNHLGLKENAPSETYLLAKNVLDWNLKSIVN